MATEATRAQKVRVWDTVPNQRASDWERVSPVRQ